MSISDLAIVAALVFAWGTLSARLERSDICSADIDYMVSRVPGGVFDLTMHPQVMGRGHRILLLERVIEPVRLDRSRAVKAVP